MKWPWVKTGNCHVVHECVETEEEISNMAAKKYVPAGKEPSPPRELNSSHCMSICDG